MDVNKFIKNLVIFKSPVPILKELNEKELEIIPSDFKTGTYHPGILATSGIMPKMDICNTSGNLKDMLDNFALQRRLILEYFHENN